MTTQLKNHKSETQLTTSAAPLVSTSTAETKFIGKVTATNTSASDVVATFWRVATATTETEGSGGNWIWSKTILAGETVTIDKLQGHVLGNSMKISGKAATASVINVDISGTTET